MRNRSPISAFRILALAFLLGAVILFAVQLARFGNEWANFPSGLTLAGVPIGRLDRQQAAQRLLEIYSLPVELHYGDNIVQLDPTVVGFELDMDTMLAAAELERTREPFWSAFWNFLWGNPSQVIHLPLNLANFSEERLKVYLTNEIAQRYDQLPKAAQPIVGTVEFQPGAQGTALDVDTAIQRIENALNSPTDRIVILPLKRTAPPRPPFHNLGVLLRQTISITGYDGVIGVYMLDLQTGEEINFVNSGSAELPIPPDVAFSASSTIKITIMISIFRRLGEGQVLGLPPQAEIEGHLTEMITKSYNPSSDWLMENILDRVRGPVFVTEDIRTLGLTSTFLGGYFYDGAPLLLTASQIRTPANTRDDVNTEPDVYNQTTPSEIGMLLADIYECSQSGGGTLIAAFPGEITQTECQTMINLLANDKLGRLIQGGVPEGTVVAHKHGWISDIYGVIHNISDAAVVYTPGGNYVLVVYMYHPAQLAFNPSDQLIIDLSRAVYNFYNLPTQ